MTTMNRQVLIIDDDKLLRKMLERAFAEQGWQCATAPDAEKGFEMINLSSPDLLVLDIFMPGKWSGIDLLRLLKAEKKLDHMAVVVVTAGDPGKYLVPSREAGADILIPKPFSPKAFVHQAESLLEGKEAKK
jgi:two-component system, NtrC family, nitrogen regulation response regulator NtrX